MSPILAKMFDSEDLPIADRVEAWSDITAQALVPNEFDIDGAAGFRASLEAGELGEAQLTALTYDRMRSHRTPRLIRRSDPGMYAIGLIRRGEQVIRQNGRETALRAGELVVYSTSHPYEALVDPQRGMAASVVVQVPRTAVPLPSNRLSGVMATRLPGDAGIGRMLAGCLADLAADTTAYSPADSRRLGGVLTELITAWLAHHADAADHTPLETRRYTQFLQIQDFIARNLADADLSPAAVAAAHHISLRTLHRLFRDHGDGATAASSIRDRRLARARRDLADPALAILPVQAIAARQGFTRPADFSRAFRAAYGMPPGDYRRRRLGDAGRYGSA